MHEISIMESTLEIACEHLKKAGGTKIHAIRLRLGLASGVEPDSLRFAFEALKSGTAAEQASLEIESSLGSFCCQDCSMETRLASLQFQCPACGGRLMMGDVSSDLELTQMEIS